MPGPMPEPTTVHSTFVIERSYSKPPERVFAAFADPRQKRRWYAENDSHEVEAFDMDFRVGGGETFAYRFKAGTPFPGVILSSDSRYEDIVPDRRIALTQTMALGGQRMSSALITLEFVATDQGCDLVCTHQGAFFEGSDGPDMREGGWRRLFERLADALAKA